MLIVNHILLRRKNKVIAVSDISEPDSKMYALTAMKNVEAYGFTFSENLLNILSENKKEEIIEFYNELIKKIKALTGADKQYVS